MPEGTDFDFMEINIVDQEGVQKKIKADLEIIHEIEKDEHRIFHKHGRGKRELVSTTAIKRKQIQKII